ncbi:hypothetical protein BIW11_09218 [Tropilaelaps mercedesae]|uniref:Ima1 N-terminal domain-containing protein n=1 Tax=Tropilaelaps mercedesae TaxID=418985 RepID=A0A1V9XLG5_9ACAR|nr:hypothetical protein BIW11_09218 [Tropilaelaps mercedesae]
MVLFKTLEDYWLQLVHLWQHSGPGKWNQNFRVPTLYPTTIIISTHIAATLAFIFYKYFRHILPVRVRCWFCGGLNKLPPANRNRFDCLYCEQYNGFSSLGDYNKDIPAQRDPQMNVFSVGAAPSGKTLSMYHNGLCELCNHRQTIKMQLRNKFEPRDPRYEIAEFQEFSQQLERSHPLCSDCKNHVRTRLAYQDAKLLPHVMSLEASRWPRRLQRLYTSELTELIICTIPTISLMPTLGESWVRLIPLAIVFVLMLFSVIHNRALLGSKFTAFPNLAEALSPLLSSNYRKILRSRNWATKVPFDLGPRINLLSIGPSNRGSLSERGMCASALDTFERTTTLEAYTEYGARSAFSGNRASRPRVLSPASFRFGMNGGTPFRTPVGTTRSGSILWPSRLTDFSVTRQNKTQQKQFDRSSQSYGGPCGDLTPPPSQDSSLYTSEESRFVSAARLKHSLYGLPTRRTPTKYHNGPRGSGNADCKEWDDRTGHTVYSTVVHNHNGSAKALWAIAFLLAAALVKLCWSDFISMAQAIHNHSFVLWGDSSYNDAVCAVGKPK